MAMFENKKIFIFGGSGSLGNELISRHLEKNKIVNYSRDECKHWALELKFNKHPNLKNIIGDVRCKERVQQALCRENPDIIIICCAIKHITVGELNVEECMKTNYGGTLNILNVVEEHTHLLNNLKCVCFISTDKSESSISAYGHSKALAEKLMIEKAYYIKTIKFVNVRYGNVLNSRGSVIPFLHQVGMDPDREFLPMTHPEMNRFIMTLEQSCQLIEYAIEKGESGSTIVSELVSMRIKDIFEIFSELYNKPIKVTGLRLSEKLNETLICSTQSLYTVKKDGYYHVMPSFNNKLYTDEQKEYDSTMGIVTKEELRAYLEKLDLLDGNKVVKRYV